MSDEEFRTKHFKFFDLNILNLPYHYTGNEASRMTLAFFCISSLELLGLLDRVPYVNQRQDWINWIYAQQVYGSNAGFRGGPFLGSKNVPIYLITIDRGLK